MEKTELVITAQSAVREFLSRQVTNAHSDCLEDKHHKGQETDDPGFYQQGGILILHAPQIPKHADAGCHSLNKPGAEPQKYMFF